MFHINIPPLRERENDILPLAQYFLGIHAEKNQKEIDSLSPDFAESLLHYPFPGNVRQLESIIATAVLSEKGKALTLSSFPELMSSFETSSTKGGELLTLAELEKKHIQRALKITRGNRTRAAKIMGIGLRTLQRKLKEFGDPTTTPD